MAFLRLFRNLRYLFYESRCSRKVCYKRCSISSAIGKHVIWNWTNHDRYVGTHSINIWNGACLNLTLDPGLCYPLYLFELHYYLAFHVHVTLGCYTEANQTGKIDGVIEQQIIQTPRDVIAKANVCSTILGSIQYIVMSNGELISKNSTFLHRKTMSQASFRNLQVESPNGITWDRVQGPTFRCSKDSVKS